jgi:hypothetical protein
MDPTVDERDCWDFIGHWRSRFGYGRIREGRRGSRCLQVHVVAYEAVRGPVPVGKWLRHSCDRPLCANPWHLEPGSAAENYADQLERGRRPLLARRTTKAAGYTVVEDSLRPGHRAWVWDR